ncbi:hypothetical protein RRG08_019077 [Elysia crispata]|uniref:Uncharacterized protein n=1 Tax=Elysia crispata TaxID=231223 RepID=A0AAE1A766_9GAST|nr:hypothetical protein RRG08_019077 [Elysia crispata]
MKSFLSGVHLCALNTNSRLVPHDFNLNLMLQRRASDLLHQSWPASDTKRVSQIETPCAKWSNQPLVGNPGIKKSLHVLEKNGVTSLLVTT